MTSQTLAKRVLALVVGGNALLSAPAVTFAETHGAATGDEVAAAESAVRTDLLDLGEFRIRGCRTTDQEVVDIRFGVQLVLSTQTNTADHHRLEGWKNRLRDQIITAIRSAAPEDYADPALHRIQRLMLFRVKRLATGVGVIGLYLTDFSLDEGETLADLMAPAVTPTPPKEPASGGH
jgi:hypothetical protein